METFCIKCYSCVWKKLKDNGEGEECGKQSYLNSDFFYSIKSVNCPLYKESILVSINKKESGYDLVPLKEKEPSGMNPIQNLKCNSCIFNISNRECGRKNKLFMSPKKAYKCQSYMMKSPESETKEVSEKKEVPILVKPKVIVEQTSTQISFFYKDIK